MSKLPSSSKAILLTSYPTGFPTLDNFKTVDVPLPAELQPGEIALKIEWLSVDPYMRGRMRPGKSYVPPFELDKPVQSGIVNRVIASRNDDYKEGDRVISMFPWQEYTVLNPATFPSTGPLHKLDKFPAGVSFSNAVSVLGMPGLTAYFGLLDITHPKEGETVFVSGAAGAVGSLVGQIAKLKGCRVVGSAGDDEKVAWLKKDLGFDEAINYKTAGDLQAAVAKACPNGVDVYFDNVGGEISDAVTLAMNPFGRISLCGQISVYNEEKGPQSVSGPRLDWVLLTRNIKKEGFIVHRPAWVKDFPQALSELGQWVAEGKVQMRETVLEGLENAPQAFINLFHGANTGKMVVKVASDAQ